MEVNYLIHESISNMKVLFIIDRLPIKLQSQSEVFVLFLFLVPIHETNDLISLGNKFIL